MNQWINYKFREALLLKTSPKSFWGNLVILLKYGFVYLRKQRLK